MLQYWKQRKYLWGNSCGFKLGWNAKFGPLHRQEILRGTHQHFRDTKVVPVVSDIDMMFLPYYTPFSCMAAIVGGYSKVIMATKMH